MCLVQNQHGKPYLEGYTDLYFNISHTRNAIAVAFSNQEIGIDIEGVKDIDFKIAERFFTYAEKEYVLKNKDRNKAFFEIWTKKEAYVKYKGKGLAIPFLSFDVLDSDIVDRTITLEHNEYILSVCSHNAFLMNSVKMLEEQELISLFSEIR